jgi:chorismate mutase
MNPTEKTMEITTIGQWLPPKANPLIISGPCSAETRDQVLATARQLHETGIVSAFRAGIWKPRTRPNEFEGYGIDALQWLAEAKQLYGMPLAVEVATPAHAEACLKAGVDILWIGARTTVNPFSVQELVEAIRGVDVPVMIKNPINPELALWIGVIERFYQGGNTKIAAVHRGFNTYEKSRFRNEPLWDIPIKLKSLFPQLPIICDPSHIAGKRNLLHEIIQQALLLDYDGFMIESHCNPEIALTDAAQQITPPDLANLIHQLKIPVHDGQGPSKELEVLRNQIDELDSSLINILAKRMTVVRDIAKLKKDSKMTVLQVGRWNSIVQSRVESGQEKGLSRHFMTHVLDLIHKESIDIQSKIIN